MTTPDVPHRFEYDFEVAATPEQVWAAIATADGISSWMMPTEVDARAGGTLVFHMGPGPDDVSVGTVTSVDAPHRIVYEEDWASLCGHAGAPVTPLVTEFVVEARSGGTCVVRVVTSAFGTGADWENEFFGEMESGWSPMLDNLRLYVQSFPGQAATSMWLTVDVAATPEQAIDAVRRRLGVSHVGDLTSEAGIEATLERSLEHHLLLRLAAPVEGFVSFFGFAADRCVLNVMGYLFGAGAPAYVESERVAWQMWLDEVAAELGSRVM